MVAVNNSPPKIKVSLEDVIVAGTPPKRFGAISAKDQSVMSAALSSAHIVVRFYKPGHRTRTNHSIDVINRSVTTNR